MSSQSNRLIEERSISRSIRRSISRSISIGRSIGRRRRTETSVVGGLSPARLFPQITTLHDYLQRCPVAASQSPHCGSFREGILRDGKDQGADNSRLEEDPASYRQLLTTTLVARTEAQIASTDGTFSAPALTAPSHNQSEVGGSKTQTNNHGNQWKITNDF